MAPKKNPNRRAPANAGQPADEAVEERVTKAPRRGTRARKATFDEDEEFQLDAIAAEEYAAARADRYNAATAADNSRARGRQRSQSAAPREAPQQPRLGVHDLLPSDPDESPRDDGRARYGQHEQESEALATAIMGELATPVKPRHAAHSAADRLKALAPGRGAPLQNSTAYDEFKERVNSVVKIEHDVVTKSMPEQPTKLERARFEARKRRVEITRLRHVLDQGLGAFMAVLANAEPQVAQGCADMLGSEAMYQLISSGAEEGLAAGVGDVREMKEIYEAAHSARRRRGVATSLRARF